MPSAADSRYLYVFLDEAGNFDFSASGTRFLIFSTITSARPFDWEEPLMSLKFDLIEHGYEPEYFHASEDPQAVRDEVFKIISEHLPYLCLDSIIVEKRKTGLALQPIERFYPRMVGYLLRYVIDSAKSAYYDEVIVITDRIPHKKKRKAVEKAIKLILRRCFRPAPAIEFCTTLRSRAWACRSLIIATGRFSENGRETTSEVMCWFAQR